MAQFDKIWGATGELVGHCNNVGAALVREGFMENSGPSINSSTITPSARVSLRAR